MRDALAIDLEWRGSDDRETAKSRFSLGSFLAEGGRVEDARSELDEAWRIFESSPFEEGLWLPRAEAALAALER